MARYHLRIAMTNKRYEEDPDARNRDIAEAFKMTPEDIAEENYYKYGTINMAMVLAYRLPPDYAKEILKVQQEIKKIIPPGLFSILTPEENFKIYPETKKYFDEGNYLIIYNIRDPSNKKWPYFVEHELENKGEITMISCMRPPDELIVGLKAIIERLMAFSISY